MAGTDLGEGTRLAAAAGAWTCFEDEAGQSMRPPKARRTRARRGRAPVVTVPGNAGRVPVAGLTCLKAGQPGRFYFRLRLHVCRRGSGAACPGQTTPNWSPPRTAP